MSARLRLLLYAGGVARVGGIESFLGDLAVSARERGVCVTLLCWGAGSAGLTKLKRCSVSVFRRPWRWGCRWGWPDRLLLPAGRAALREADVVLFGKLFDEGVHRELMGVKRAQGGPPFVLATPYRPAEIWAERPPAEEVLNSFEAIVVQAGCFVEDLRRFGYRGDVRVLPYLPPPCEELAPLPTGPPRIGFLGRLVADKNLPLLMRAFALVRNQLQGELHLFGEGSETSSLRLLGTELRLGNSVRFHGRVPHAQVPAAIDSCHLWAFSSVREGQVLAALEILSRGRPLVATPVGAFPELLSEARFGVLAPLDSAEGYAQALSDVTRGLAAGALVPETVQSAYRQKFPRDRILEQYLTLFKDLAEAKVTCR